MFRIDHDTSTRIERIIRLMESGNIQINNTEPSAPPEVQELVDEERRLIEYSRSIVSA